MKRPMTYYLTVVLLALIQWVSPDRGYAQTSTWNYIKVKTYAPLTDTAGLRMFVTDQSQTQITYQDGMARDNQSQVQNGTDSVILIQSYYDFKGRKEAVTKPVKSSRAGDYNLVSPALLTGSGFSVTNGITDNNALLKQVYGDAFAFERTLYNAGDPLDRVSQVRPYGAVFHNNNHYLQYQYGTDSLKRLFVTTLTDENGRVSKTCKDFHNRTVRQELVYSADSSLVTEFRYDGLGNLIKSIPPLAVRDSIRKGILDSTLVTHYRYNSLNQLTDKWSADEGKTEYVYDRLGQLRFVKDAKHEPYFNFMNQQCRWTYYKYDAFGRVTEQGEFTGDYNKNRLQDSIRPVYYNQCITETWSDTSCFMRIIQTLILPNGQIKKRDTFEISIDCSLMPGDEIPQEIKSGDFTEDETGTYYYDTTYFSDIQNYSLTTCTEQGNADRTTNFPLASHGAIPTLINRYDSYGSGWLIPLSGADTSGSCSKTRLTRSKILDPNTNTWTEEAYTYDAYGRVKTKWTYIPELASVKKFQYIYDAAGKLLKQTYQPQDANESLYQWFKYDAVGRLDTVFTNRTNNFFTAKREAVYDYDDNYGGKVKKMQLGNNIQSVDYSYTIRDWLKSINDVASMGTDKFAMKLGYEDNSCDIGAGTTAQYNGNIRWVMWQVAGNGQGVDGYAFMYDGANRLKDAVFKEFSGTCTWTTNHVYSERSINYDANGNIQTLTRGTQNSINYQYDANKPNRLLAVRHGLTDVFTYDNNGNMITDSLRGSFNYDYRNMPVKVTRSDTTIEYAYDAGGQRIKKMMKKNGNVIDQSIYIRNGANVLAEYRNSTLDHYNIYGNGLIGKLVPLPNTVKINNQNIINSNVQAKDTVYITGNSRIDATSRIDVGLSPTTSDKRYYYLSDHLGSIRVLLKEDGNVESWSDYYPFGKESRGSSTSNEPKEQFTGKERDIEIGLDYFGARYYNYDLGRWLTLDPLKDKYPNINPYHYVFNNPISLIDATGLDSTFYILNVSSNIESSDLDEITAQVQYVLDENGIPMRVKAVSFIPELDPTDVSVSLLDGDHPTIKKMKETSTSEGTVAGKTPEGSPAGIADVSIKTEGATNIGLGNSTTHEGLHGMGLTHKEHGEKNTLIYPKSQGGVTIKELNKKDQKISDKQKSYILNEFLNKPKKVDKPRDEEKKDEK